MAPRDFADRTRQHADLRARRAATGLRQQDVAELAGISRSLVAMAERGHRRPPARLVAVLDRIEAAGR